MNNFYSKNKMLKRAFLIVAIILFFDQLLKIYIKTNFFIGQETSLLGHFFKIHFIENNGMAFGMEFGGEIGKIILTLIRIIAVFIISYIIYYSIKRNENKIFIYSLSLILAGAIGNIIDSAFYGLIFSESDFWVVANIFPESGGYAGFMQGKVVDMFYAPILHTYLPSWIPIIGGNEFLFFRPIFNIADSSISIGVVMFLLFYKKIFAKQTQPIEENIDSISKEE